MSFRTILILVVVLLPLSCTRYGAPIKKEGQNVEQKQTVRVPDAVKKSGDVPGSE